jgi:probable phosphoglycerate mutase
MALPTIYLIRHGETEWARLGKHTSVTDVDLTEHGESEARDLKKRVEHISFQHVFTSPRLRARHTCEIVGLKSKAKIEQKLAEWNYGVYEGLVITEVRAQAGDDWDVFKNGCPEGESPAQVSKRVDNLIAELQKLEGNVALFAHGHILRAIAIRWIKLPIGHGGRLFLSTASLSVLGFEHERIDEPVISLWNEKPR